MDLQTEDSGSSKLGETTVRQEDVDYQSDYENFVDTQIVHLIHQEREKNKDLTRADELGIAIDFCKKYLIQSSVEKHRRTEEVLAKLVELKLELEQLKEFPVSQNEGELIKKVRGHEFTIQSASGRNPYCEVCLTTIWRLIVPWRRCKICGFRAHDKCVSEIKRGCVSLKISKQQQPLSLVICPENSLMAQNYECAECFAPIGFDEGSSCEPRLCDYNGKYYCKKCHWNDEMLLVVLEKKPIIDLNKENCVLFKYVNTLDKMRKLRSSIMLMKCYFLCCRKARKMRILQHLNPYQHFVESDNKYTLDDLVQLAHGKLLHDIELIVDIFKAHITMQCEICKGNAFICELCDLKEPIFPFSKKVSMCQECCCVFHQNCFERVSKRCTRCTRRKSRKASIVLVEEEETQQ
uniref:Phorbol-ester/DAG-type domain-containing protein n=1 Tax=Ditylenchus dipsaci TaxID=166011 RepID=A0A915E7D5_9BILA